MLTDERLKSENYLENALKHERDSKNYLSMIATMKNDMDELEGKLKDSQMLETMFCELKAKYSHMQIDHHASMSSTDKQYNSKNDEIVRLGNKVEEVI